MWDKLKGSCLPESKNIVLLIKLLVRFRLCSSTDLKAMTLIGKMFPFWMRSRDIERD